MSLKNMTLRGVMQAGVERLSQGFALKTLLMSDDMKFQSNQKESVS